ncbi:MAG: patatin-like phospholipase family protein, partial [Saprospiraceae bacterium]|nr:patatin-like phospholipase family protein [Saprospiraceae bacterium]
NINRYKWRVDFYIDGKLRLQRVRSVAHYNQQLLSNIFNQHHKNATALQLVTIVSLISLGFLMDYEVFRIPAGASVLILFAMLTSVLGALWYWLRGWHVLALLVLMGLINMITVGYGGKYKNKAYGLKYNVEQSAYHYDSLPNVQNAAVIQSDIDSTLEILNNWRKKFGAEKPKLVLIGVSGGGLRASVWSMRVLQYADSVSNNELIKQTVAITGASGGMLGAGYYRELYLQHINNQLDNDLYNRIYIRNMAKDLQNAVFFSIAVNDLFLPWSKFNYSNEIYPKDRGYIFELQFNQNTNNVLNKRLSEYQKIEQSGQIPMMFITPSIANDGKRLIISPQGKSYLTLPKSAHQNVQNTEFDGIDFYHFFKNQSPENLKFTSALRMNATYPYILPNVHLPSLPPIEVVDAGWRDNVGVDIPIRFAHIFKDWIQENTSGVVFIQIRASEKVDASKVLTSNPGIIKSLINPLGLASQFMGMQDYNQDAALDYIQEIYGNHPTEIISFMYRPSKLNEKASMSFHLTEKEKEDIINAIYLDENQASLERLRLLIRNVF